MKKRSRAARNITIPILREESDIFGDRTYTLNPSRQSLESFHRRFRDAVSNSNKIDRESDHFIIIIIPIP